ncbi:hypothetical protein AVEN_148669-1 [Araneus ventricosus]|uniref:Uncharacterized protein n=1 Tax=Araneus ventricosus TaxID=182803 RepID=A0A4Y2G6J7_ARAVE|nr:hypothetical protein AVEN_148669-1 [Araneus ventricosus]
MLSASLLLYWKIVALLLLSPLPINSHSQLLSFLLWNTMQFHKFFGGQLLAVLFLKLIDIILIHLQSHDLGQRHNLVDYRPHRYCLKPLKVTLDNVLRTKLLPSRSESSLGDPFPLLFDQLEKGNAVEVQKIPRISKTL